VKSWEDVIPNCPEGRYLSDDGPSFGTMRGSVPDLRVPIPASGYLAKSRKFNWMVKEPVNYGHWVLSSTTQTGVPSDMHQSIVSLLSTERRGANKISRIQEGVAEAQSLEITEYGPGPTICPTRGDR